MTAHDLDDQPGPLEPLRQRDFRYFLVGNVSSQLGTFCQAIDGVRTVRRQPLLAALLFIIAACAIGADPPVTLGPEFAHRFHGSDTLAGAILGAFGAGSVVGAFVAGSESARHHRRVAGLLAVFVIGLTVFSLSAGLPMIVTGSFLAGFGFLTAQTRTSTLLVRSTPDHERGRVMALWAIAFIGVRPFASLLDGFLGETVGVRTAALFMALPAAAACLLSLALDRRHRAAEPDDLGRGAVPAPG